MVTSEVVPVSTIVGDTVIRRLYLLDVGSPADILAGIRLARQECDFLSFGRKTIRGGARQRRSQAKEEAK